MIVKVAVPGILQTALDYECAFSEVDVGARVRVPLRRQYCFGVVIAVNQAPEVEQQRLKAVRSVIDVPSLLDKPFINWLVWIAAYYHYPLFGVLETALPARFCTGYVPVAPAAGQRYVLTGSGAASSAGKLGKQAYRLQALLQYLQANWQPGEVIDRSDLKDFDAALLQRACKRGWLQPATALPVAHSNNATLSRGAALTLTNEQQHIITALKQATGHFAVNLIYGVTGSGKTEVYMAVMEAVLAAGQQALVLVPEISLTPQTVQRFRERFTVEAVVLHSGQSAGERARNWERLRQGAAAIAIATRSGVFAACRNLGVIIIDEEHDLSFKQQSQLHYHARDIAIMRAKMLDIPIIMGSATPSLESYYNARTGKYCLYRLTTRPGTSNPAAPFSIIDLREQPTAQGLSPLLREKIAETLARGEQAMLFLNRRGYAPALICPACRQVLSCPRCEQPYTLHESPQRLECHFCAAVKAIEASCPHGCGALVPAGVATEQLEEALAQGFPRAEVVRIDRSGMTTQGALDQALNRIHSGEADIIVGTQMIAKGHHFPNVTMVGIVDIDGGLYSAEIRALERTGQLITQVAGRCGREKIPGAVYLQTHVPEHPLLQVLLYQDYEGFMQHLLEQRRAHALPPFCFQALLRAQAHHASTAAEWLAGVKAHVTAAGINVTVLGPAAALRSKQAGFYRQILILQAPVRSQLQAAVTVAMDWVRAHARQVRWVLDIDPQDIS